MFDVLYSKSRGTEKSNFPPKGPTTFKFLEIKLLLSIVFRFAVLDIKLWLKDDNILY